MTVPLALSLIVCVDKDDLDNLRSLSTSVALLSLTAFKLAIAGLAAVASTCCTAVWLNRQFSCGLYIR